MRVSRWFNRLPARIFFTCSSWPSLCYPCSYRPEVSLASFIAIVTKLIATSHDKAMVAHTQINRRSGEVVRRSLLLLGASLVLALFCAVLTVRMTTDLFRRMEWQAGELSRVSWHMLENQENAARRFSHEL